MEPKDDLSFDIQGHRGCRGLMPENSIPGFLHAVDLGVHTLELDVVISKDHQVIVSHEPWISGELSELEANARHEDYNIYQMSAQELEQFDCGSKVHPRFPDQKKLKVHKPTLSDAIREVESHIRSRELRPIRYNIEIKSLPEGDGIFHPEPALFTELVLNTLEASGTMDQTTIQSFDARILEEVHKQAPETETAWLIEANEDHNSALSELTFQPDIYSCYYKLLTPESVAELHAKGIKVIPWTINDREDMVQLMDMGIDGIITDYPDVAISLHEEMQEQAMAH